MKSQIEQDLNEWLAENERIGRERFSSGCIVCCLAYIIIGLLALGAMIGLICLLKGGW